MSPARKRHGAVECLKVGVSKKACYLSFGQRTAVIAGSKEIAYRTVRGETLILDLDSDDRIIGIEILGNSQPCQRSYVMMEPDHPTVIPPMKDEL